MKTIKAIRVDEHGGPEVLKVVEIPLPEPGDGQVLVRVKAVGVNPVETYLRSGAYSSATLPYFPGMDAAGVVESLGPKTNRFKTGDRVYTSESISGTYAEYTLCLEEQVHPLPPNASFAQGAALGIPYGTSFRGLFHRAKAQPGETLLVHGATGGVGSAAVQWAKAAGLIVIGTGGTEQGRKLVKEQGADFVLNHRDAQYTDELMKITEGRGVDIILEMLANVNLAKDLTMLAKYGRVVVIGNRGKIEINPRDAMSRDASILGMTLF